MSSLVAASILSAFGCNKPSDGPGPSPVRPMSERKFYTDSTTQDYASQVGLELGVLIVIRNTKDFTNETEYKRTIGLLQRNRANFAGQLSKIDRIEIGGDSGIAENLGRYTIRISINSSEKDIVNLIARELPDYEEARLARREISVITNVEVVDRIGFGRSELPALALKLRTIAREVVFSQDPSFRTLVLADSYGITPSGMTVNITDSEARIIQELKAAIDARLRWQNDVSPILTTVRLNLTIQPGVFTGSELTEATVMAKKNAVLIKSLTRTYSNFVIGKRWDIDRASNTVLMDFRAPDDVIRAKLTEIEPPVTDVDFNAAATTIQQILDNKGYHVEKIIIDLPRTVESLDLVRQFTTGVASAIKPTLLQRLDVKNIQLLVTDATSYVSGTKTLFIRLPSSVVEIELLMTAWILNGEFDSMKFSVGRFAVSLGLDWQVNATPSITTNERLKAFLQWFTTAADEKLKTDKGLRSVLVTIDDTTVTGVVNGVLTINLMNFAAEKMKDILYPPVPAPVPAPVPPKKP